MSKKQTGFKIMVAVILCVFVASSLMMFFV